MNELESLKKTILENYERLDADAEFTFSCHPGVTCFNQCCSDVNIFLTPYDVLRLKNRLGISSQEFLDKYTQLVADKNQTIPAVQLLMTETETKHCHFVDPEKGCTVYEDRPWPCRMYPVGQASPAEDAEEVDDKFFFILKEEVCKGFEEDKKWKISEWMENQGVKEYDEFGEYYKDIALHGFFNDGKVLTPQKIEMFFLSTYNLDKFKEFISGSTFLDRFEIDKDKLDTIMKDDEELLKFGFNWLRFCLFGEKTMTVKNKDAGN